MDNQAWLDGLKPGDKVIMDSRHAFDVVEVLRRTKTGRIVVRVGKGEREFNANGRMRTSDQYTWGGLEPVTQAALDRIERANLVYRLDSVKWGKLTLDQLRAVAALLDAEAERAALFVAPLGGG